ncbi:MAG: HEPN domain-containing protein [Armatimonadota bacterium]|nr:HEPN domain-containing protein [Armatimonadota bacterium]MDW8143106.1 HEPN domain-containing protein [Armatimonadota bacterium]
MASNFSTAQTLMREAQNCLTEAKRYFAEGDWNFAIRRAQECIELALKSLLKAGGWEVPKLHDVGAIVVERLRSVNIQVEAETAERIINASERLAQQRAPAFYWEVAFTHDDAKLAVGDAEFVLDWALTVLRQL